MPQFGPPRDAFHIDVPLGSSSRDGLLAEPGGRPVALRLARPNQTSRREQPRNRQAVSPRGREGQSTGGQPACDQAMSGRARTPGQADREKRCAGKIGRGRACRRRRRCEGATSRTHSPSPVLLSVVKGDPLSRNNRSPMRKSPIGIRRMREEAEVRWQPGPPLSTSYASESPDSTTAGGESRSCLSDSGRNASISRHAASLDASTVGGGGSGPRPALTGMTLAIAAWLGFLSRLRGLRTSSSWFHPGIGRFRCRILGLRSRCSSVRPRGRLSGRRWSRMKCWPRRKSVGATTSPCFCSAASVVAAVQITRSRMLRPRRA